MSRICPIALSFAAALTAGCASTPDPRGDFPNCEAVRAEVARGNPLFRGIDPVPTCGGSATNVSTVDEYVRLNGGQWCQLGYSCAQQSWHGAGN